MATPRPEPVLSLLAVLAAVVSGRRAPALSARVGQRVLGEALADRSSVVVEVRFTGLTARGTTVGGSNPEMLRAAGRLIMLKVSRLGFTAEAGEEDLRKLFDILALPPRSLEERGGFAAALAAASPFGIYASTTAGELYKPPARPPEHTPGPASSPDAAPEGGEDSEGLVRSLAGANSVETFEAVARHIAGSLRLRLREGNLAAAVPLVQALVEEADRQERGEPFRDAARRHLHAAVSGDALEGLIAAVERAEPGTREIVGLLPGMGEEAALAFEELLIRSDDEELDACIFVTLARSGPARERLFGRATAEGRNPRARRLFALAGLPGLDPGFARRLAEAAAAHSDPQVRMEAARAVGAIGGRAGVRILAQLLSDRKRGVRLLAVTEMARVADPAAVPHLAELLDEGGDEEIEIAAVEALGEIGVPEAIPPLLAVLGRRQLFSGKRLQKRKVAAVRALGKVRDRRAREVLTHLASSRNTELAAEAALAVKGGG